MNKVYQLVWNRTKRVWQAASELSRQCGGGAAGGSSRSIVAAGTLFLFALPLHAADLPSGGQVVGGHGSIGTSGSSLTVNQKSQSLAINWQEFSVAEGHRVNFVQPNAQAAALNRVTGNNVSEIRGAINANGRVFLVNPNGVMFSSTARVDVGALVASTLDISTEDFMAGNYSFAGASSSAIINQGHITAVAGGHVAMIAARIINSGTISTFGGSTLMGAGSRVTLDLGGPVKIDVEEALLETYIKQGGAVRADGGLVYLTAKAAGALASSIINHTGITEARTLASDVNGQIMLMGDMEYGQVRVAGTLDASAPDTGNGGFIETSAAHVDIAGDVFATTKANSGKTGEWLIDPIDITIAASGGNVTGATIANALRSTDVTLDTTGSGSCTGVTCPTMGTQGDIFVNDNIEVISGDTDATLTLKAYRNIIVDAGVEISSTSGKLNTVFWARAGGNQDATDGRIGSVWLAEGARVDTNGGDIVIGGGTDPLTGNAKGSGAGSAEGNAISRGASINGTLDAGGGDISIRGRGRAGGFARGVSIAGDIRTEGTGNIAIFGYASGGSDAVAIGDSALGINQAGSITAENGTIQISAQRGSGKAININSDSSITSSGMLVLNALDGVGAITATDNNYLIADRVLVRNAGTVTLSSSLNRINTFAASAVGDLTYVNRDAMTIGALRWDDNDYRGIEASGTIDMSTLNGDLAVVENILTASGAIDAITLNAGRSTAAGTASEGNIHVGHVTLSTGAGGRTTLYTGSVSGSTGLTGLVGSGSGRFRYNSDEVSVGYSTAIGTGLYAIYRERPALLVGADFENIVYGAPLPSYTAVYSGFLNGDSSLNLTGTAEWLTESDASAPGGSRAVGRYDVRYTGGLNSGFGYAIVDNSARADELTITRLSPDPEPELPDNIPSSNQLDHIIASILSTGSRGSTPPAAGFEFVEMEEGEMIPARVEQHGAAESGAGPLRLLVINGGLRQSNDANYPNQE